MSEDVDDSVAAMTVKHAELGRKAAELALDVLESVSLDDIPVASAVALLKFGVELERKSLLGADDDDDDGDPFDALAKALTNPVGDEEPREGS